MTLKTLKDLEWTHNGKGEPLCVDMSHKTCCATCSRQEVIKWIKELERYDNYCLTCMKELDYSAKCYNDGHIRLICADEMGSSAYEVDGAVRTLKHIFNITEEDIK